MALLADILPKYFRFNWTTRGHGCWDNLPYPVLPLNRQRDGRMALAKVLNAVGVRIGVEVGVYKGHSAACWCRTNPALSLTCIDPWKGRKHGRNFHIAAKNLKQFNVKIMRMTSMDALSDFEDCSLDFVHIDGNHEFDHCCSDIIFWSRKVKPGGVMLIHDYVTLPRGGVVEAVNAYTHCHHIDPWYVTTETLPTAFWQMPMNEGND